MTFLGVGLGFVIGLSLGVLGGGGSILTVPIFVYVLGLGAKEAIAMSLFVVGAVSMFGAAEHWRAGNVNVRVGLLFGGFSMAGTFLGARIAAYMTGAAQLALFAVVMLLAAVFMFRDEVKRGRQPRPSESRDVAADPVPGRAVAPSLPGDHASVPAVPGRSLLTAMEGIGVGVLTGIVGVGGGFLIVPALVLLAGVPMKVAIGTSLMIIALKSATGFAGYLDQVQVPWGLMLMFSAVAVAGILTGTRLVRHIPPGALRRAFAIFLVLMGSLILHQNRIVFLELFS
jgi:uncharacterized protein